MTRYAIDAPTLVQLVAEELEVDAGHQLVGPSSLRTDALDLLLTDVRRGRRGDRDAMALHDRMTGRRMRLLGDRVSRRVAWQLAQQRPDVTVHDAEYVAVAKLQADALVTSDPRLTALAEGVVTTAAIEALAPRG